jgi:RimJ/RimL family protein N-acetyltransferase
MEHLLSFPENEYIPRRCKPMPPFIITDEFPPIIFFDHMSPALIPWYIEWFNDPDVSSMLTAPKDSERIEQLVRQGFSAEGKYYPPIVIEHPDDPDRVRPLGHVSMKNMNYGDQGRLSSYEIGIVIGEKRWWNQNLGEKALRAFLLIADLNINKAQITAHIHERNIASRRLFEKLGFNTDGNKNGEYEVYNKRYSRYE